MPSLAGWRLPLEPHLGSYYDSRMQAPLRSTMTVIKVLTIMSAIVSAVVSAVVSAIMSAVAGRGIVSLRHSAPMTTCAYTLRLC